MSRLRTPSPRLLAAGAAAASSIIALALVLGIIGGAAFLATMLHHRARPIALQPAWLAEPTRTERGFARLEETNNP